MLSCEIYPNFSLIVASSHTPASLPPLGHQRKRDSGNVGFALVSWLQDVFEGKGMRRPNHCIGGEGRLTASNCAGLCGSRELIARGQMAQEMVGKRLPLMCVEVHGELRKPNPQMGIVSSKTGFFGEGGGLDAGGTGVPSQMFSFG